MPVVNAHCVHGKNLHAAAADRLSSPSSPHCVYTILAGQGWIAPVPDNRWSTLAKIVPNLDDESERDGTGARVHPT